MQRLLLIACMLCCGELASAAQTFSWTGAEDTDWNSNGNWTTNGVVADVSLPATGDTVVIDSGSQNITANIDQSAVDLASLVIGPNYAGIVGNASNDPLKIGSALLVVNGGGATQYIGSGATYNWDVAIINNVGPNGSGDCYISGTIPILVLHKGDVHLTSGTVTSCYIDAESENNANVDLTVTTATITTLYGRHGDCEIDAGTVTTVHWDNGTLNVDGGTYTTVNQRGGTIDWATTQTLTALNLFDGTFDASNDVNAKTITDITMWTGAVLNLNNAVGNITVTNGTKTYGGTFTSPEGQVISYGS